MPENNDPVVKMQHRPFNSGLYALKALGIGTAIVGVTAICAVGVTTWYLDVNNVGFPPFLLFFEDWIDFCG